MQEELDSDVRNMKRCQESQSIIETGGNAPKICEALNGEMGRAKKTCKCYRYSQFRETVDPVIVEKETNDDMALLTNLVLSTAGNDVQAESRCTCP